jgi:hypothetical protein
MESIEEARDRVAAKRVMQVRAPKDAPSPASMQKPILPEGKRDDGTFAEGNPGGPGRPSLRDELDTLLAEIDHTGKRKTRLLAEALFTLAMRGSVQAHGMIWDRLEGSAVKRVEMTGANGGPITHADVTADTLSAYALEAIALVEAAERIANAGGADGGEVAADGAREPVLLPQAAAEPADGT